MECPYCNTYFEKTPNYCTHCGTKIIKANKDKKDRKVLYLIIAFYVVTVIFLTFNRLLLGNGFGGLNYDIVLNLLDIAIVIGFVCFDALPVLLLYRIPKSNWKILIFSFVFPFFSAFVVYFGLEIISRYLGFSTNNYIAQYHFYPNYLFWAFLFTAIIPPVFEELAFRGFLFNQLLKITTPQITIITTAFLFALVHFSFLSLIWIFPFGLLLGYLRHKYQTLWYGMLIHFIHNFTVLAIDYYYFYKLNI